MVRIAKDVDSRRRSLATRIPAIRRERVRMFEITEEAANAILSARAGSDMPDSTALRIAPVPTTQGGLAIGIAFTDGPEDGDMKVSDKADLTVYVAPELADTFERAILKVTGDREGVELELRTQADLHDHGANGDDSLPKMLIQRRSIPGGWF